MYSIKDILNIQVAPALGCTEPAAVALCTAAAGKVLTDKNLDSIELWLSPSIYKNAFAVAIPGAKGAVGIDLAAALGFLCGDPKLRLEVLEPVNTNAIEEARKLIDLNKICIHLAGDRSDIFIHCCLKAGTETAEAIIQETHDNLVRLSHNGREIPDHPLLSGSTESQTDVQKLEDFLRTHTLEGLMALIESMDDEDFDFVKQGVDYNLALSQCGLTQDCGLGVGRTLEQLVREGLIKRDMILDARILTSSAADARMAGAKLPAMSSAGSGNHGLTAVLPIWAVKDYLAVDSEQNVLKAIALSHVVTAYIKAHTGRLSAVCGCSIAAGAGAGAGIAYLMGGNLSHVAGAIKNLVSDLAGVICDGAKAGCALKLATAAGTAVQSALFSLHGINVKDSDGIITVTPEQTTRNVGRISTEGMIETDRTILKIMMDKQFSK
ncbi:MAG: serine dehydratase subunit alpha family protein [Planctomycetes bacterium]|nr:serine dehydratase subunit alpha family protein [Planctomycetota bacterium]